MRWNTILSYVLNWSLKRLMTTFRVLSTESGMRFQFEWEGGYLVEVVAPGVHAPMCMTTNAELEDLQRHGSLCSQNFHVTLNITNNIWYIKIIPIPPSGDSVSAFDGELVYALNTDGSLPKWQVLESHPGISRTLGITPKHDVSVSPQDLSSDILHGKDDTRWTVITDSRSGVVVFLSDDIYVTGKEPKSVAALSCGVYKDTRYRLTQIFKAPGIPRGPHWPAKDNSSGALRGQLTGVSVVSHIPPESTYVDQDAVIGHIHVHYDTGREDLYQVIAAKMFDCRDQPLEWKFRFNDLALLGPDDITLTGFTRVYHGGNRC